jgi:SH2 domain
MAAPSTEARIEQFKASKHYCANINNKEAEEFLKSHQKVGIIHQEGNQFMYSFYSPLMGTTYHTPIEVSENGYKLASINTTYSTIDDLITSIKKSMSHKPPLTAREFTTIKQLGDNLLNLSEEETKKFFDNNVRSACILKKEREEDKFLYRFVKQEENTITQREITVSENGLFSYIDKNRQRISTPNIDEVIKELQKMTDTTVMKASTYQDNMQRAQLKGQLIQRLKLDLMDSLYFMEINKDEAVEVAKKHGGGFLRKATHFPFAFTSITKKGDVTHVGIELTDKGYSFSYKDNKGEIQENFAPNVESLIIDLSNSMKSPVLTARKCNAVRNLENSEYFVGSGVMREDAEKFLKNIQDQPNRAILRAGSQPNTFALSFNHKGKTNHIQIKVSDKGEYTFGEKGPFQTVPELITNLQKNRHLLKASEFQDMRAGRKLLDKERKAQNRVVLFLDFDGTLSPTAGSKIVTMPLYNRLAGSPFGSIKKDKALVSEIVDRMGNATEEEKKTFALTKGAENFLRHALDLIEEGQAVDINIISRNHFAYMRAVLESSGQFTSEELDKIKIVDREDGGTSKNKWILQKIGEIPGKITAIVCDDDKEDCAAMKEAAGKLYGEQKTSAFNAEPGQFNWDKISQKLDECLGLGAASEFRPT